MSKLVMIRHGQSQWNLENKFTGWVDVPLTEKGIDEAKKAGRYLKSIGFRPAYCFTSALQRAQNTLTHILEELNTKDLPIAKDQALNERHYGDLQGKNKAETAEKFGADQVQIWRRSYDVAPPNGESLKDTAARSVPYFKQKVLEQLKNAKDVLLVAHGNSIRSIIQEIERMTPEQILKTEVATGEAWEYEYTNGEFKRLRP